MDDERLDQNTYHHIGLLHQGIAAAGASIVSAVVVNPLDVAKTRIQAQRVVRNIPNSGTYPVATIPSAVSTLGSTQGQHYRGTYDALRRIAQHEGTHVLWRGTGLSLVMSVPMVGIYLPLYDAMLQYLEEKLGSRGSPYSPLLAGTAARSVAVYCTSPIELMRVRMQSLPKDGHLYNNSINKMNSKTMRNLWRGVGATLWRDVPFSGLYWALVEPIRRELLPQGGATSELEVFKANAVSGGVAGALAAAITTPFDVAKTQMQLYHGTTVKTFTVMKDICLSEGISGIFKGWSARSAKAVPACAIVLSAYEMIKFFPMAGDT